MGDSASGTDGLSSAETTPSDPQTAQLVYTELRRQIDQIDTVLEAFANTDLSHTPACTKLENRRESVCLAQDALQHVVTADLTDDKDQTDTARSNTTPSMNDPSSDTARRYRGGCSYTRAFWRAVGVMSVREEQARAGNPEGHGQ